MASLYSLFCSAFVEEPFGLLWAFKRGTLWEEAKRGALGEGRTRGLQGELRASFGPMRCSSKEDLRTVASFHSFRWILGTTS